MAQISKAAHLPRLGGRQNGILAGCVYKSMYIVTSLAVPIQHSRLLICTIYHITNHAKAHFGPTCTLRKSSSWDRG